MKNIQYIAVAMTLALTFALNANAASQRTRNHRQMQQRQERPMHRSQSFSRPYGMAGCGLGSMIVGKKGGQIFAATTNGTAYNQIFAISAGTSNCVDSPNDEVAQRMDTFIATNQLALATDIARGQGETLNNLAGMMGCADRTAELSKALQSNFGKIFPAEKVYPNEVTDSIITTVLKNQNLSASCKKLS